jgi:cytochrome c oxidase subunit 1
MPKMFGFMLNERIGKIQFWLMFIGFNLTFFPMHFLGLNGMPRRVYTYPEGLGFEFWNQVETAGSMVLGFSFLVFIWNIWKSKRSGETAPADPWDGATLEWSIPSPPQEFNFPEIPTVQGRDPLWEVKRSQGRPLPEPPHVSGDDIHLPNPSVKPLITAIGIGVFFTGFLLGAPWPIPASLTINLPVVLLGFALTAYGIFSWAFEPAE